MACCHTLACCSNKLPPSISIMATRVIPGSHGSTFQRASTLTTTTGGVRSTSILQHTVSGRSRPSRRPSPGNCLDVRSFLTCRIIGWTGQAAALPDLRTGVLMTREFCRIRVPPSLLEEASDRFGDYPAKEFIYGFAWPCMARTRQMAERLVLAARARTKMALWLAGERMPDWDTAIIVTSELHSAVEAMWHGWDENHPLHNHASAVPAREGIQQLYIETDRMLAALSERFPDARMVVFAMHGMGPNTADVPSMVLLPELLYRLETSQQGLSPRMDWQTTGGFAMRSFEKDWAMAVHACLDLPDTTQRKEKENFLRTFWRRLARGGDRIMPSAGRLSLSWMPAARYEACWHRMASFALPSFYDGQIRVNLAGRESARVGGNCRLPYRSRPPGT